MVFCRPPSGLLSSAICRLNGVTPRILSPRSTPLFFRWQCLTGLSHIRQQSHIPRTFNCLFHLSLTTGAISAALPRVYLAAIGQKLLQSLDVLVINVLFTSSAKTTLCVSTKPGRPRQDRSSTTHSSSHIVSFLYCSHTLSRTSYCIYCIASLFFARYASRTSKIRQGTTQYETKTVYHRSLHPAPL